VTDHDINSIGVAYKALCAVSHASLVRHETDAMRAKLRDMIAEAWDMEPEFVQDTFEALGDAIRNAQIRRRQ
jgi:uncharacterized protein (DUF2267 family)